MKKLLIALPFALALASCMQKASETGATGSDVTTETATEQSSKAAKVAPQDLDFMKDAARGGLAEVRMGELGLSNGEGQPVKDFSQRLIDDHKKINQELEKIAIKRSVILPDSVSEQHKTMLQH